MDQAHAVILTGGTLQPIEEKRERLFPWLTSDQFHFFSCSHIIPPESILPVALSHGPSGQSFDFSYSSRSSSIMVSALQLYSSFDGDYSDNLHSLIALFIQVYYLGDRLCILLPPRTSITVFELVFPTLVGAFYSRATYDMGGPVTSTIKGIEIRLDRKSICCIFDIASVGLRVYKSKMWPTMLGFEPREAI